MSATDDIAWAARCAPNAARISAEMDEERKMETDMDHLKPHEMLRALRLIRDQALAHGSRTMRDFARSLDGLIDEYDDLGQQVIDEEAGV